MNFREKLEYIAETGGYETQSRQAQEECAELIQAINKLARSKEEGIEAKEKALKSVIEEIADVKIMANQLAHLLHIEEDIAAEAERKIERQLARIEEKKESNNSMKTNIVFKRTEKALFPWEDLGRALKDGALKEVLKPGDQIVVQHKDLGRVVFNVLDQDREKLVGDQKHSVTLQMHKLLLPEMPFDKNNSNKWEDSTIRKMLNSEEFINGFEKGFRELLAEVYKENDDREETKDKFFLLSVEEMKDKKKKYKYFTSEKKMIKTDKYGATNWHWTRSANRGLASLTYYVNASGIVNNGSYASNANTCAPACAIAK